MHTLAAHQMLNARCAGLPTWKGGNSCASYCATALGSASQPYLRGTRRRCTRGEWVRTLASRCLQAGLPEAEESSTCHAGPPPTPGSPHKRCDRLKEVVVKAGLRGILAHLQQLRAQLLQARGRHGRNRLAWPQGVGRWQGMRI